MGVEPNTLAGPTGNKECKFCDLPEPHADHGPGGGDGKGQDEGGTEQERPSQAPAGN